MQHYFSLFPSEIAMKIAEGILDPVTSKPYWEKVEDLDLIEWAFQISKKAGCENEEESNEHPNDSIPKEQKNPEPTFKFRQNPKRQDSTAENKKEKENSFQGAEYITIDEESHTIHSNPTQNTNCEANSHIKLAAKDNFCSTATNNGNKENNIKNVSSQSNPQKRAYKTLSNGPFRIERMCSFKNERPKKRRKLKGNGIEQKKLTNAEGIMTAYKPWAAKPKDALDFFEEVNHSPSTSSCVIEQLANLN